MPADRDAATVRGEGHGWCATCGRAQTTEEAIRSDSCADCDADATCWCCGEPAAFRGDGDPWEGRLDGYCDSCATTRCDTTDSTCAVKRRSADREWLALNPHVAENYPRVCEALGLEPWTAEAPVALGLIDLSPLDGDTIAALRGFDDDA